MVFIEECLFHIGILVRSALQAGAGGMIAAVDLRVAVLAGPSDDALTGRAPELGRARGLTGVVERARMADRWAVALLTKLGPGTGQQLVVVRAMGVMAVHAVFPHRRVFPEHGAALLGMTGVAHDVHAIRLEQWPGRAAMGVMAIDAGHLAFRQRHVGALPELGALLLVAGLAGFVDGALGQQAAGRNLFHRIVAVGAAQFVGGVHGTGPVQPVAALVAGQALTILSLDGGAPALGEADDQALVLGALGMPGARSVAGFADLLFLLALRIQAEDLGVKRVAEMLALLAMTVDTDFFADVGGVLSGSRLAEQQAQKHCRRHCAGPKEREWIPDLHALVTSTVGFTAA